MLKVSKAPLSVTRLVWVTVAFVSLVWLPVSGAQGPGRKAAEAPAGFSDTVEVNVVNVEVFVTDKKGNPVTGLTAKDFEILEDGKKVKVSNFLALGRSGGDSSETPGSEPAEAESPAASMVIVVDNFSIHPHNRQQVLDALKRHVDAGLEDGDRFALASYDGYLRIRQTFTAERELLHSAIEGLDEMSSLGLARYAQRKSTIREGLSLLADLLQIPSDDPRFASAADRGSDVTRFLQTVTDQIDQYAASIEAENRETFFALSHLVNALAAVPGRKALVYVGDGLEMQPAEELYHAVAEATRALPTAIFNADTAEGGQAQIDAQSSALDALSRSAPAGRRSRSKKKAVASSDLLTLTALANSSRVSFYTIRAQGNLGGMPAELDGSAAQLYTPQLRGIREQNLAETVKVMAAETGGLARTGFDIGTLLGEARDDLSSHYLLGFRRDHSGDGRFHKIKVKVRRKGVRVRSRTGYVDKGREARLADGASAALLLEIGDNPHGLGVFPDRPQATNKDRLWLVPIQIEIPLEHVTLQAAGGGVFACEGELYLASEDPNGTTAPVQRFPLRIEVDEENLEEARGRAFSTELELALREGPQRLAVGFFDHGSGLASFVGEDLEVGN